MTRTFSRWTDEEIAAFNEFFGGYRDYFARYCNHSEAHKLMYNMFLDAQLEHKVRLRAKEDIKPDNGHSY